MIEIAIQMLIGDRVKFLILICALAFSSLLMMQQVAVFFGVMKASAAVMLNSRAPIWVVDPLVEHVTGLIPMKDTDLPRVGSVSGVEWALPIVFSTVLARNYEGKSMSIQFIGVDTSTLLGIPPNILEGSLEDLWKSDAIIVDKILIDRFSEGEKRLAIGDAIDINDHELRIVGVVQGYLPLSGLPAVYTTYERAITTAPATRRNLSAVLVWPRKDVDIDDLLQAIDKQTGLRALSESQLFWMTMEKYFTNTSIPVSFLMTIFLGFVVGIAISCQTFYSFVYENLRNFAALKVMGCSAVSLRKMVIAQAFLVGFIGYGIGALLAVLFGLLAIAKDLPFILPWQILLFIFMLILCICSATATLAMRKINQVDPVEVFRG
jgi:putative ABC transport system permease protein